MGMERGRPRHTRVSKPRHPATGGREGLCIATPDAGEVVIILTITSVSSVYVRRGSDITDCNMKCPHTRDVLQLNRECGDKETNLLELWCNDMWSYNYFGPRLHLNTSSGCWRLTDTRKDDSCLYVLWRHNSSGGFWNSTDIAVLDPVLISNISSNSSQLGQDIAVSVQFYGEEAAVTWEVDGGSLPHRYWLIDDNGTLIIPSAQREDAGRRLRIQITNPVSEETREYLLEITDAPSARLRAPAAAAVAGVFVSLVISIILLVKCWKITRHVERNNHSEEYGGRSSSSSENDKREESHQHDSQHMEESMEELRI
ncbi:hypothetical protein GDO78_014291 [Eleutherodactylus coqui]|uniref:Ig-like domain-containing protein n=1 Tax=Eleutherodactylus coqui TaxID=57060 RepID=A0A8J6JL16_ELECQ|nr:hypothetical protein GDO78_014291 [Eleutherodactylus coqui]